MLRMAMTALLALAMGCGGSDGGGDDDGNGGSSSGVDGGKAMNELSNEELTTFCTWYVDELGGTGTETDCGDHTYVVPSVDECKQFNCDTCEATVAQNESCTESSAADPCNGAGGNQSCGPVIECVLGCMMAQ